MQLAHIQQRLIPLVNHYHRINPDRHSDLFLTMLPTGYEQTTLPCVDPKHHNELIFHKVCLGMLITLYDDYADNPRLRKPKLLQELYKLPQYATDIESSQLEEADKAAIDLAILLHESLLAFIKKFDRSQDLMQLYLIDLQQFYQCNRYCEWISLHPTLVNINEFRRWIPYNMGMVMAGMLDLLVSDNFDHNQLNAFRDMFYLAQRYGSICNTLSTLEREISEHDITNEAILTALKSKLIEQKDLTSLPTAIIKQRLQPCLDALVTEQGKLIDRIAKFSDTLHTSLITQYQQGLLSLKQLHQRLEGVI